MKKTTTKKRSIKRKFPKYVGGGQTYTDAYGNILDYGTDEVIASSIPGAAERQGAAAISNTGSALGGVTNAAIGIGSMLASSASTNNGPASKRASVGGGIASGALSGASAGATIGSVIPGVGTAIGGAVGAVVGGVTGGLSGADDYKSQKREDLANRSQEITSRLQQQAYEKDPTMGQPVRTFRKGGIKMYSNGGVGMQNAFVDHNEVIKNPQTGQIDQVKGNPGIVDGIKADLQPGSMILSDTEKIFKNKSYAKTAERFDTIQKKSEEMLRKARPNSLEETTAKLNQMNVNKQFDKLLKIQEDQKIKKQLKGAGYSGSEEFIQDQMTSFKKGGVYPNYKEGVYGSWDTDANRKAYFDQYSVLSGGKNVQWNDMNTVLDNQTRGGYGEGAWDTVGGYENFGKSLGMTSNSFNKPGNINNTQNANSVYGWDRAGSVNLPELRTTATRNPVSRTMPMFDNGPSQIKGDLMQGGGQPSSVQGYPFVSTDIEDPDDMTNFTPEQAKYATDWNASNPDTRGAFKWPGSDNKEKPSNREELASRFKSPEFYSGNRVMDYLPALYNIGTGLFDKSENLNAQDYQIQSKIKPFRYNEKPEIQQNRDNSIISRYNNSRRNTNTGADMAFGIAANNARQKADSEVYGKKYNIDSQAQMMADQTNLKSEQYNKETGFKIKMTNMANQAKKRDFLAKGFEQLSEGNQRDRKERNAFNQDNLGLQYANAASRRVGGKDEVLTLTEAQQRAGYYVDNSGNIQKRKKGGVFKSSIKKVTIKKK